jgi:hypothetical protein
MPARLRRKRRLRRFDITPEAIELFRRGLDNPRDRENRIALAAALGRSKLAACPLDSEPRSLIGCDTEPVEVVLGIRAELFRRLGGSDY